MHRSETCAREGTGLGLSLSYDIIKAHGGAIKVESKEGEGTEFIIQISVNNWLGTKFAKDWSLFVCLRGKGSRRKENYFATKTLRLKGSRRKEKEEDFHTKKTKGQRFAKKCSVRTPTTEKINPIFKFHQNLFYAKLHSWILTLRTTRNFLKKPAMLAQVSSTARHLSHCKKMSWEILYFWQFLII